LRRQVAPAGYAKHEVKAKLSSYPQARMPLFCPPSQPRVISIGHRATEAGKTVRPCGVDRRRRRCNTPQQCLKRVRSRGKLRPFTEGKPHLAQT
jgi:hypothetical protein